MGETLRFEVNGHAVTYDCIGRFGSQRRDKAVIALLVAAAMVALSLLLPRPAWAGLFPTPEDIVTFITKSLFGPIIEGLYALTKLSIVNSTAMELLTKPFDELLSGGNDAAKTVYTTLNTAKKAVINPLSASMLSLVILMQLTKISQRMDANAQMPALKEVFQLFVFCAVWMWLLGNSTSLLKDVFELTNGIGKDYFGAQSAMSTWPDSLGIDKLETFDLLMAVEMFFGWLLSFFIAVLAAVMMDGMALVNGLQLYFYMFFAPAILCFLGFDETKQWGLGFIKGFVACCLSRLIMLMALWMFPVIMTSLMGDGTNWVLGTLADQLSIIACSGMLFFVALNSGKYARDILGG